MDSHNEWTVARAVAPPPRPECDLYRRALDRALDEVLTRLDVPPDAGPSGDATSGTSR
ncbi:MAG TPA: hypothetical protein VFX70_00690 [Mycobacteriales bacterium]|nr:hypothetical protein [Mycobacteriales bacterium]